VQQQKKQQQQEHVLFRKIKIYKIVYLKIKRFLHYIYNLVLLFLRHGFDLDLNELN
jgi:hypothetical protein